MMSRKLFYAHVFFALILLFEFSYGDTNILTNPGFESGTTGWTARWLCSINVNSVNPHSGAYCGRVYNRLHWREGIQQDVKGKMVIGETYTVSGWVRTSTAASSTIHITFQQTDGAGTNYYGAANGTASNSNWVQVSGSLTLNVSGTLTTLLVYVDGPDAGIDLYVDDMVVYGPWVLDPNKASNPNPHNGVINVPISSGLSWNAPTGYTPGSYDVYFGTDPNAHSNPKYTVYTNSYDPLGNLKYETTYHWAVDSNDAGTIYPGDDWSFTTAEQVSIWRVDERCFLDGPPGSFDDIAVKDPSIVYYGGKWHLFYTGRDSSLWRMGYASATSISELNSATRYFLGGLNATDYFCAPQVFWFEPQGKWYLIYNSGLGGATFSTNTDISNPSGWTKAQTIGGIPDGYDYWMISDGSNVYCFYSTGGDSRTISRRSTSVANFPSTGWGSASTVATDTFEGVCVYKSNVDGKYYMLPEDINKHYELWTASSLGGTWTKVEEQWAHRNKLVYNADHWTDQVSHGELIRAGVNERMEISDINHCEFLIQGMPAGDWGDYGNWPYDLGLIRQCPAGLADLNLDCDVDFVDFAILASQWQQTPGVPSADIAPPGGDGIVDINDLGLLVDSWLWEE